MKTTLEGVHDILEFFIKSLLSKGFSRFFSNYFSFQWTVRNFSSGSCTGRNTKQALFDLNFKGINDILRNCQQFLQICLAMSNLSQPCVAFS